MSVTTVTGGSGSVLSTLNITQNTNIKAVVSTALAGIVASGPGSVVISTTNGDSVSTSLPLIYNP
ncbi:MAG TPA: hypothetical protein VG248_05875, partial [Caulobacteraceae bacterium]|nr:hypothetical protein [Caulobacteraceae bacterium]